MERYVLSKPLQHGDSEIKELEFDFDGLSVADLEKAERIARTFLQKGETLTIPEFSKKYQQSVAAIACGYPVSFIRTFSAKDYTQVCMIAQNFLLGGDSEAETEESDKDQSSNGETSTSSLKPTKKV